MLMITEFFERLLTSNRGSRDDVKRRLKLVLAHDRSTLNASTLEKMREEIWEETPPYFTTSSLHKTGVEEVLTYIDQLNKEFKNTP